jgi:hypothetical protein
MGMAMDERTAQAQLTPEERRALLRAFADRMLLKISAMDDPKDMPGVERAVRVAAVIERVYSRCDRAERQIRTEAPERAKAETERATHEREAIKARVSLANTLKWGEERRLALGPWWDAAQKATQTATAQVSAAPKTPDARPDTVVQTPNDIPTDIYNDYTDGILDARAKLAFRQRQPAVQTEPPPLRNTEQPPPSG